MPMRLIYQLLELLDHVTQLMRLLDRNKKRRREREVDTAQRLFGLGEHPSGNEYGVDPAGRLRHAPLNRSTVRARTMYEFAAVVHSLNHLTTLLKSAHSLSNYNELVAAVSEVSSKLMAAQSVALGSQEKQASLASELADLKDKLRQFEHFKLEAGRYELKKLQSGGLVFAMKSGMENGQPEHYLCATCWDKGEITRLQPESDCFLACPLKHGRVQIKEVEMGIWSASPEPREWV